MLDDEALIHEEHAVRDLARKPDLVRDKDHGPPFVREFMDDAEDFAEQLGIQGGRGLIEEKKRRLLRQRARDRDTLLLSPGQSLGISCAL